MARWSNALQTKEAIQQLKREAVLREAGRIFSRKGYHNTSLTEVAKQLDVSKATLYNYVKDKQEILFEFHMMALDIGDRALRLAQGTAGTGAEKLGAGIRAYIATVSEELGGYGVIAEVGALKPEHRKEVVARHDRFRAGFIDLIEEGQHDGSLRSMDPHMAVVSFVGALQALPNWFSPAGRLTADEVADSMTDVLMHGMAAAPI